MLIAEIVPAFQALPKSSFPVPFPRSMSRSSSCAPNALLIGFIVAMITSIVTILITGSMGIFPTVVIPLISTCFFEIGCASIVGNATGGVRGAVVGAAVSGVIAVLLVGFGAYFFNNTIQSWMLVFGGQDFDLWGMLVGAIARLIA